MTIYFNLNDENETPIRTFYDMESNPFSLGDIINLSVDELQTRKYENYKKEEIQRMFDEHRILKNKYHLNQIKLVKEAKYIEIANGGIAIEYHCELIKIINSENG